MVMVHKSALLQWLSTLFYALPLVLSLTSEHQVLSLSLSPSLFLPTLACTRSVMTLDFVGGLLFSLSIQFVGLLGF